MYSLPPRGSGVGTPVFFVYFNRKSCILVHSLAPKMGSISVYQDPCALREMKTVGRCCRMRPEGPKIEAEGRERGGILARGSKPHQLGVWQWCKQDQLLKTKIKTKITRPRPLLTRPRNPTEINKGTWRI